MNGVVVGSVALVAMLVVSGVVLSSGDDSDGVDARSEGAEEGVDARSEGGHGTHFCLGANLARLEIRLLLEEMTSRLTNLRPATEPDVEPNVFARAVRTFDLAFDLR